MNSQYHYFNERHEERRRDKYAVVAFLPTALDATIAAVRERYDTDHNLVRSHVTVVFPFHTVASLDELVAVIKAETYRRDPFRVELSSVGDFYPKMPVIYWRVAPCEPLMELYYGLHSKLGLAIPFKQYVPHVTVGREISHHRLLLVKDRIAGLLPDEAFRIDAVDLITPLADQKWVSVRRFPFLGIADPL